MIKINLLPPEKRKKTKRAAPVAQPDGAAKAGRGLSLPGLKLSPVMALPVGMAALVIIFIAGSFLWLGFRENNLKERRDELRVELNKLNRVILRIDELKENTRDVVSRMEVIVKVDQNRFVWPRTLDEISSALPRYTWLQTISEISPFPQLTMRIEGNTMSNILLSELLANLEMSTVLTGVRLISSVERSLGGYDTKFFVIECESNFNQRPETTAQVAQAK
ncbi:MAG: PilN domain-containing protein [Candidatus Glassbacteria bacterium]|nr:PilN domain-containing protein [Candidatus Glassbacteria bacterium]